MRASLLCWCVFLWICTCFSGPVILRIGTASGPAGSGGHRISLCMDSDVSVAGLQWTLTDQGPFLLIDSVVTTPRTQGFTAMTSRNRVILFDLHGRTIDPGGEAIVEMFVHVDSSASESTVALYMNPEPLLAMEGGAKISDIQVIPGAFKVALQSAVPADGGTVVQEDRLMQNYPNPFNAATLIPFQTKERGFVQVTVYDLAGRTVAVPVRAIMAAGRHSVTFDGHDLPSGLYFYMVFFSGGFQVRKMMLLK